MACNVCHGQSGCPVCREDQAPITCQTCNGSGVAVYLDAECEVITLQEWELLPKKGRYTEDCEACDGEGWVYKDKAPDYEFEH